MNKIIKKVIDTIEKKGFEAYIIGGFVRDLLLGKNSFDIDICTNATPKDLIAIFPGSNSKNLGGIAFKIKEYHFEITTYREEIKYKNRKPIEFNYINNLMQDLKRRDFTINTICMNSKGEIIDLLNGTKDLVNFKLKIIGDPEIKLTEDPLRIMRAIRFATVLNFNIDSSLYKAMQKHSKKILTLSNTRIREELDKILLSPNLKKGLKLLEDLNILKYLKITYKDITPVKNIAGMYSQIEIAYDLPFTKVEKENITNLKKILKKGEITNLTVYKYGLYLCLVAGEILNIDRQKINKIANNLPINEQKDINITPKDIVKVLGIDYSQKIKIILNNLEKRILNGELKNKKSNIIKYLKENQNNLI